MRRIFTLVTLLATAALADEPPAGPVPELAQLKDMIGVWKCHGKTTAGGTVTANEGTYTVIPELDDSVLVGRLEQPRNTDPLPYKARDIYGYDAGSKTFTMFTVDNLGAWGLLTSKGWRGDKMEWKGKSKTRGHEVERTMIFERKGPREALVTGSAGPASFESSCKK